MTDMIPFKLRALHAITDALKTITPANGYVSDLSDTDRGDGVMIPRVYRGRAWYGDNDPTPLLSILEGIDPADDVTEPPFTAQGGEYQWKLLVQGFIDDDPENPTDPAYVLMADVRKLLASQRTRKAPGTNTVDPFGLGVSAKNRIIQLEVGPGVVRPADDLSSKAYFWLSMTLRVFDDPINPYA